MRNYLNRFRARAKGAFKRRKRPETGPHDDIVRGDMSGDKRLVDLSAARIRSVLEDIKKNWVDIKSFNKY